MLDSLYIGNVSLVPKPVVIVNGLIINSENTFIQSSGRVVAAVGVDNLIIIDTPDALLVIDKSHTQDVKLVTSKLKQNQQEVLDSHRTIQRPWGNFTTLQSGASFKIKCIEVNPLKSLSLQSHRHRSEHWIVIEGEAEVTNQEKLYRIAAEQSSTLSIYQSFLLDFTQLLFCLQEPKHRTISRKYRIFGE